MSPDWEQIAHGYLERNAPGGAYDKLLTILTDWKSNPENASRVAAFMEVGKDIAPFPSFENHLTYRRDQDTPLQIVFFGEVAAENCGTALGARGNHYAGGPAKVSC